jgi:ParB family chromosome partitioning protein
MKRKEPAPPRLGRGLAALLGDSQPETGMLRPTRAAGIHPIPVELLEAGPFQPRQRMQPEPLEELASSIRARGILQPILARPHPEQAGRYQIIAGERRWRAAQMAGLHEVPVHVRDLPDADAMAASLVENLQRSDLNAIEEAEGLQRLLGEFAMTQEQLAGAVGKSRSHVANTIRLLQLPAVVRHAVMDGALTAGHARALINHPEPDKAAQAVIARRLSVRQTEQMVQAQAAQNAPGAQTGRNGSAAARAGGDESRDPEIVALERSLRQALGLKVDLQFNGRGGQLRLHYDTLDQLDGVLKLLNP